MNQSYTKKERQHLETIKSMPYAVCGANAPSEAHHIRQNNAYSVIPLCVDCHRGSNNGLHGRKAMWKIKKMDELDALFEVIKYVVP